jgi:hypothetical protein
LTTRIATVSRRGISVVATLGSGPDNPVAACSDSAHIQAAVAAVCIPVVAGLHSRLDKSVTAFGVLTGRGTGIGIRRISVVAFFSRVCHAVTAPGVPAIGPAGVGRRIAIGRPVIALLPALDHPVAAGGKRAIVPAAVRVVRIAVVAGLDPRIHKPVAAQVQGTGVKTAVVIAGVPIVAHLFGKTGDTGRAAKRNGKTELLVFNETVAALGRFAVDRTGIIVVGIPVIAFLSPFLDPVSAVGKNQFQETGAAAAVTADGVSVVARLDPGPDMPVSTRS